MPKLNGQQIKTIVFIFPLICFSYFLILKIVSPNSYASVVQEDSAIEYAQAVFYFLSAILALVVSVRFFRNRYILHGIMFAVLCLGMIFTAGEEISWGQRLFDIKNPAYFDRYNLQAEMTLHNLIAVQPHLHDMYILLGFYGTFAWFFISKMKKSRAHILNFVAPDWFISSYFLFALLVYTYFEKVLPIGVNVWGFEELLLGGFFIWRDQEPAELLLSLGFLVFTVAIYLKTRKMFAA